MTNTNEKQTIEYDVITYQINQKIIRAGAAHNLPLVWDIPTIEQAQLILDKVNIKGAQICKEVEYYYSDQEAQEHRLSALADIGIMTNIELEQSTSKQSSGVA